MMKRDAGLGLGIFFVFNSSTKLYETEIVPYDY
jgi:hypothetical protein